MVIKLSPYSENYYICFNLYNPHLGNYDNYTYKNDIQSIKDYHICPHEKSILRRLLKYEM